MNRVTQQLLDNRSCTGVDLVFANANGHEAGQGFDYQLENSAR